MRAANEKRGENSASGARARVCACVWERERECARACGREGGRERGVPGRSLQVPTRTLQLSAREHAHAGCYASLPS